MKRMQLILIAVLVFQVALAAYTFWPRSATGSSGSGPLFDKLSASDIVALTVYDKPDTSIKISKQGDKWVLPGADDFPADSKKVGDLLTKIVEIKTDRLVTKTEASQARLKVAANDYLHRLDLQTADGTTRTLYIGSAAGSDATHVRAGDRPEVYLAGSLTNSDATAQAGSWIDPVYLSYTSSDVSGFTLKNANGQFAFKKDGSGNWTMDGLASGEALNSSNIGAMMDSMGSLRMSEPLGKTEKSEWGFSQPGAELAVTVKKDNQEKTYTLTVGTIQKGSDGTNSYVVKSSESPYYVKVAESSVKDLVDKNRQGFLQAQPTTTPAAAGVSGPAQLLPTPAQ